MALSTKVIFELEMRDESWVYGSRPKDHGITKPTYFKANNVIVFPETPELLSGCEWTLPPNSITQYLTHVVEDDKKDVKISGWSFDAPPSSLKIDPSPAQTNKFTIDPSSNRSSIAEITRLIAVVRMLPENIKGEGLL